MPISCARAAEPGTTIRQGARLAFRRLPPEAPPDAYPAYLGVFSFDRVASKTSIVPSRLVQKYSSVPSQEIEGRVSLKDEFTSGLIWKRRGVAPAVALMP